jgi:SAM-dependent methyltransferase
MTMDTPNEKNSGLHGFLGVSAIYRIFQSIVGRPGNHLWLMQHHYRPKSGFRIVDIGCGPATILNYLPQPVDYYGFDPNQSYIDDAEKNYSGTFLRGDIDVFMKRYGDTLSNTVDLVICSGVLHHVSRDEIDTILSSSRKLLREGGRFAALEPTFLEKQDWASRAVLRQDRGKSIFMDHEWASIMKTHYPNHETWVLTNLLRIPYTHILLTGYK